MNLPASQFLDLIEPLSTTVSSPRLDLIVLAWDHIAVRYLKRLDSNRILAGRVRSVRLLAVHDAIQAVIDPGNGYIYKEISDGNTIEASSAAAIQASHDILAAVFHSPEDREDLDHLRAESLDLIGKESEKAAGVLSGGQSAAAYLNAFQPLLQNHRDPERRKTVPYASFREPAHTGRGHFFEWRRSA